MDAKMTSALAPRKRRIVRRSFENLYDWIGRTLIRKTGNNRKPFPLLGERTKGEAGVNTRSTENVEGVDFQPRIYGFTFT
jgi:hypothetical protein